MAVSIAEAIRIAMEHHHAGRLPDAERIYRLILAQTPDQPDANHLLGVIYIQHDRNLEALPYLKRAVQLVPTFPDFQNNLGIAYRNLGRMDDAVECFAKTVQLAGDRYSPLVSLAGALRECGRLDEAIHAAREAIALRPGEDQPWNILGEALEQQEKLEDAIVAFQKAVEVKSSAPGGHVNLGNAARAQGKFEEALRHYEKAIQCGDPAQAHFHRGLVLLLLGKFAEGWEEYERRWDLWHFPRPKFDKPLWDGSDLNGRTILLYTEQGFGDGIQFVRYASMVAKRGGRVVLDCQPELTSLLEGVEGLSKVVERGKPLGDFDVHMPLMSLPRLFGTWLESIPANVPYLHADPARVDAWRARLNTEGRPGKLRVGLVWAGSARYSQDWRRSGELKLFAPLAGIDADWYSLQKGEPAKQANDPSHGLRISDFTSELHDFADTAAFINHLDLLITVDTAAAHLAGALNRPVWTLLPFVPDWRWLLDRDDSPWYPRMRLFRQREVGNWRDVMLRVAGELQALIDKKTMTFEEAIDRAIQLHRAGRLPEAEAIYRNILAQNPNQPQALHLLGLIAHQVGKNGDAILLIQKAISIAPDIAEPHSNLGKILHGEHRFAEAIASCRQAVALAPNFDNAWHNLGHCLHDVDDLSGAIACYRRALELNATNVLSWNNLGSTLKDIGQAHEAIAAYRRAIEISPDFYLAYSNLLYTMHYPDGFASEQIFAEHREWARRYAEPLRPLFGRENIDANPDRPLRVGYVSSNFRDQVINFCFEPVLHHHDRQNFQIYCYSDVGLPDFVTRRLMSLGHEWRECSARSDAQVADLVRQDRIDILVDLTGHIANNRLLAFARKPAPIQVSYLGYQDTTGMSVMDYVLTDEYTNPPGQSEHLFTEKLVRLPGCFWCYLPQEMPDVGALPATRNGYVTFAFVNNFSKVTPRMMQLWCRILKAVAGSRLLILVKDISACGPYLEKLLRENEVSMDRLILEAPKPKAEFREMLNRIDIALDPFPFNGHTTTHDCLWMGVPVVHLSGKTYASRYGGSVLKAVGLDQWITTTPDEYVHLAVKMANDLDLLSAMRKTLRQRVRDSVLVDGPKFTRNLEAAYCGMWREWCASR